MLIGLLIVGSVLAAAISGYRMGRSDGIKWTHKQYKSKRDYGSEAMRLIDEIKEGDRKIAELQRQIDHL